MENCVTNGSNSLTFFQLIMPALAALGACAAAFFTLIAANATAKANIGQTLLACLDKYISIMKDKRTAIEKKDRKLALEFYRELFDLHWSEFHLWHEGAIKNHIMKAWLAVRKRNYEKDKILVSTEGNAKQEISYADVWLQVKSEGYFEPEDPFILFMDIAHTNNIYNIKELKRNTKRKIK